MAALTNPTTFFEDVSTKIAHPAILLIDSSGSTKQSFNTENTIFEQMTNIVKTINATDFRFIFWNSNAFENTEFENTGFHQGTSVIPYVIGKDKINQPFKLTSSKITGSCLTFPHLAFNAIPSDWINNTDATHIYFVTDGEIGYHNCPQYELSGLRSKFAEAIKDLFKKYNNIHLHILTVENKKYDFNKVESTKNMAGGDVYSIIQTEGLTSFITEFTSYTPNNLDGHKHFGNIIAPAGFIPFNDKIFPESKTNEFVGYLKKLVTETDSEDELLKIIQHLSSTIKVLIKDKSSALQESIVDMFCNIFNGTQIDPTMVNFILKDTVKAEIEGRAIIYSEYRSKLKDFYKQAQMLLTQNGKNAMGMEGAFFTLPINGNIMTGSVHNITESYKVKKQEIKNSCVNIGGNIIPVISLKQNPSGINEQCIRQYVRMVVAHQYKVNQMDDIVFFVVLGIVLQTVLSDVSDAIKDSFRKLGTIMLKKKRMNTDMTELSRLENGDIPCPNNKTVKDFHVMMETVNSIIGVQCKPMTLWYAICLAMKNEQMIAKQLIHCNESIDEDFPDMVNYDELLEKIKVGIIPVGEKAMPENLHLDYKCVITLNDCSHEGGYRFSAHGNLTPQCHPIFVLSRAGHKSLLEQPVIMCPVCYTNLTYDDFNEICPLVEPTDEMFGDDFVNPFKEVPVVQTAKQFNHSNTSAFNRSSLSASAQPEPTNTSTGTLILMKGAVGAGKTTFSNKLQKLIEEKGMTCINEGVDKYCKTGMPIPNALNEIKQKFKSLDYAECATTVVIIDTCGDASPNYKKMFDYNFSKWTKITVTPNLEHNYDKELIPQYMAWSLRNVLNRELHTSTSDYWLNPESATTKICVDVHSKKCKIVFGKKTKPIIPPEITLYKSAVMAVIEDNANAYQSHIDKNIDMDNEVQKIMAKIDMLK